MAILITCKMAYTNGNRQFISACQQELVTARLIIRCRKKVDDDDSQLISTPLQSPTTATTTNPNHLLTSDDLSSPSIKNDAPSPPVTSPVDGNEAIDSEKGRNSLKDGRTESGDGEADGNNNDGHDNNNDRHDNNNDGHDNNNNDGHDNTADSALVPDPRGQFLRVTALGKAAYKGGVDLDWSQRLYDDLKANLQVTQVLLHLPPPLSFLRASPICR